MKNPPKGVPHGATRLRCRVESCEGAQFNLYKTHRNDSILRRCIQCGDTMRIRIVSAESQLVLEGVQYL